MYNVWIISHEDFSEAEQHDPALSRITVHSNIHSVDEYMSLLLKAIDEHADLLILHPPSSEVIVNDTLLYLKQYGPDTLRKVIVTNRRNQVDQSFSDESDYRTIQINQTIFKKIFPYYVNELARLPEHEREVNTVLHSALLQAICGSTPGSTTDLHTDPHKDRNVHGPLAFIKLATDHELLYRNSISSIMKSLELQEKHEGSLDDIPVPLTISGPVGPGISSRIERVLLIDDEHQRGWSTVFAAAIFGNTESAHSVTVLSPDRDGKRRYRVSHHSDGVSVQDAIVSSANDLDDFDSLSKGLFAIGRTDNIVEDVKEFVSRTEISSCQKVIVPFDLILLDYRLEEEKAGIEPETVSGYKLAKAIHEIDPSIPMIVVSASDKVWTLLSLRREGAWDYYQKPGAEMESGYANYIAREYERFIERIEQTSRVKWVRQIHSMSEWLSAGHSALESGDPIRTIADTVSYISSSITEFTRLENPSYDDSGVSARTMNLCFHLLVACTESIKEQMKGYSTCIPKNENSSSVSFKSVFYTATARLVINYRNLLAHNSLPDCVKRHRHLLNYVTSLTSLCSNMLDKPIISLDLHNCNSNTNYRHFEARFIDYISACIDNGKCETQFLIIDENLATLKNRFSNCELNFRKLRSLSNLLMAADKTSWPALVSNMLLVLQDVAFQKAADSVFNKNNVNIYAYIRMLYTDTIEKLLDEYAPITDVPKNSPTGLSFGNPTVDVSP